MKTKLIKTLALVAGLAAGSAAFAAGDIYEIVPCTQDGTALLGPVSSVRAPLVAGEQVYFKIRLARTAAMMAANDKWTLVPRGLTDIQQAMDWYFSRLMIGIYVSGRLTYARYENYVDSAPNIRDFIFSYKMQPGDFALPIRLAGNGGPAGYGDSSTEYLLLNNDKWSIEDKDGNPALLSWVTLMILPLNQILSLLLYTTICMVKQHLS